MKTKLCDRMLLSGALLLSGAIPTASPASVSLSSLVPKNAKTIAGALQINSAAGATNALVNICAYSNGIVGYQNASTNGGSGQSSVQFVGFPLSTPQQCWWYCNTSAGTMNSATIVINGYTI